MNLFRSFHRTRERLHIAAASLLACTVAVSGWILKLQLPVAALTEAHSVLLRLVRRRA